jgi:hypothetical protein
MARPAWVEPLYELTFSQIGSIYTMLADLDRRVILMVLSNFSDQSVLMSFDNGASDHLLLLAQTSLVLDLGSNSAYLNSPSISVKNNGVSLTEGGVSATYFMR